MKSHLIRFAAALLMLGQLTVAGTARAEGATPGVEALLGAIVSQAAPSGDRRVGGTCQPFAYSIPGSYGGTASTSGELCLDSSAQSFEMSSMMYYSADLMGEASSRIESRVGRGGGLDSGLPGGDRLPRRADGLHHQRR